MASATPKFRLLGIPVQVDPFFAIILLFIGFASYAPFGFEYVLSFTAIAAVSILIHELGHALAFRSYGIQPSIMLYGMGGLTSGSGKITPARNIVITLAGPLPPLFLIGLPAWYLLHAPGHSGQMLPSSLYTGDLLLTQLVFVNVFWSLLNLIPVIPLDGGLVSSSVFEMLFKGRGRQIANVISLAIVGVLLVWSLSVGALFLIVFGLFLGYVNVRELSQRRDSGAASASEPLAEAHRALLHNQPQVAEYLAHEAAINARDLEQQRWANELLGWARLFSGDVHGAEQQARVMPPSRPPSQSFYGSLALLSGRYDEGLTLLTWAFAREAAGPAKSLAAVAAARAGATDDLAAELRALGRPGLEAVRLLGQLLDYAGYHDQAVAVAADPARPPLSPSPPGSPSVPPYAAPAPPPPPPPPATPSAWPGAPPSSPSAWPSRPPTAPPSGPSPWQRPGEG